MEGMTEFCSLCYSQTIQDKGYSLSHFGRKPHLRQYTYLWTEGNHFPKGRLEKCYRMLPNPNFLGLSKNNTLCINLTQAP